MLLPLLFTSLHPLKYKFLINFYPSALMPLQVFTTNSMQLQLLSWWSNLQKMFRCQRPLKMTRQLLRLCHLPKTSKNDSTTVALMSFHKFRKKWNLVFNHLNEKDFVQEQKRTNAAFNFLSRKEGHVSCLFPSRCWIFPIPGFPFFSKEDKIRYFLLFSSKWDKDTPPHFQKIWKYHSKNT